MGGVHLGSKKCIHNFGWKPQEEGTLWRHLICECIILKLIIEIKVPNSEQD
jgi:hypothetical protein